MKWAVHYNEDDDDWLVCEQRPHNLPYRTVADMLTEKEALAIAASRDNWDTLERARDILSRLMKYDGHRGTYDATKALDAKRDAEAFLNEPTGE